MARYRINDFKYFIGNKQVTAEEYLKAMEMEAEGAGVSHTKAKQIVIEDRQTAYIVGEQVWHCVDGTELRIVREI